MNELPPPVTVAAVDIDKFGTREDALTQLHLRRHMYQMIADTCAITRVPWPNCYHEDRGDGALFIPPLDVAADRLLDPFAHHLTILLRRYNQLASATAQLRLRLAVHTGRIHRDEYGVAGPPLVHVFRLLDAPAFKRIAGNSVGDLSMIVSDRLYTDAIESGGLIDTTAYKPHRITCKETQTRAWIWTPPAR